jgi:hypothetical protein
LGKIVYINVVIDDDKGFCEHHLAEAPQSVHDLARLARILLLDRDDRQVVKNSMNRQVHIDDFRQRYPNQG